jgi:serine protease Do
VLKKVKPAIVSVNGASGWIYEASGIIVTNNHVVEGAQSITVRLNDGKIDAGKLPTLVIGDVSRLKVGDSVVAVGNPLGKGIIATQGTISRLGVPGKYYSNIIGTNAELNTGSSGGALVNMAGEIIGITFQKDQEGMGYAINIQEALPVIQRLAK